MLGIKVRRERAFEGAEAVLADAFEALSLDLAGSSRMRGHVPDGMDVEVTVVLGGNGQADGYGVDRAAVGFHAVCSPMRVDEDSRDTDGDDEAGSFTLKGYHDLPEGFEAHVNMEAVAELLGADRQWTDGERRVCDLHAALVTVPHEVLHAVNFARASGGRTPLEVYDDADVRGLREVQEAADALMPEDRVEDEARMVTEGCIPLRDLGPWLARLDEAYGTVQGSAPGR